MRSLYYLTVLAVIGLWALAIMSYGDDWRLELVANARLQVFFGFLVVTAMLLAMRRRAWTAVAGAGLVLSMAWVAPWIVGSPASPDGDSLEILHLNVFAFNNETEAVAELIRESDADIVFLAEMTADWRRRLRELDLPYELVATPGDFRFGITAFARTDVASQVLGVSDYKLPTPVLRTSVGGTEVTVVSFHTSSPVNEDRAAARGRQFDALAELMGGLDTEGVLVGDLNATPWTAGMDVIEGAGFSNSMRSTGWQPSWPAGYGPFMIPIDHVFHSDGLEVVERRTVDSSGSDHLGVFVRLQPA